jgi:transcriptional regulator with XRE-family HTH domain
MPGDASQTLDVEYTRRRHLLPLGNCLAADPETASKTGRSPSELLCPNQCVVHAPMESIVFRFTQATLSMRSQIRKGNFRVMKTRGERIRHVRAINGMTQEAFADALKVKRGAVGNWERGQGIKTENLIAISERFHVPLEWLSSNEGEPPSRPADDIDHEVPREHTVPIVGYVGAGAAAHFYAIAQGNLDEVAAPEGSTNKTVAVEIRGESLGSLFDRWLVFYDDVRSPITPDLIGKLCVVGLPDDRVLIKKVRRGSNGLYRLLSEREDPIENVAIAWAARVKSMVPR